MTEFAKKMCGEKNIQIGFTLIEVIICMSIVAILICLAIPQYNQYLAKTNRAAAKLDLFYLASKMEDYFLTHNSYEGATIENLIKTPHSYPHYSLKLTQLSKTTYTLMAICNEKQKTLDKTCSPLTLNYLGQKSANY